MIWIPIVIALFLFVLWLESNDKCPRCRTKMDSDYHGYQARYSHCHKCGYCTCGCGGGR